MAFVALFVIAMLVVGVALALAAVLFARASRARLGALVATMAAALLVVGGNYARCVPQLDDAIDWLVPPKAVRMSTTRDCAAMANRAVVVVGADGDEDPSGPTAGLLGCPVETVVNAPGAAVGSSIPIERCWRDVAPGADDPLCYQFAFLEVDRRGEPIDGAQVRAIRGLLAGGAPFGPARPTYAIAYVHGWRHGAGVGDDNVRRLRVQASYAASHLRERCRVGALPCAARVVAIYVAWPGATGWDLSDQVAGPHFPRRKRVSDDVGFGILRTLDPIYADLRRAPGSAFLLEGHSLGGNALLAASIPRIEAALPRAAARAAAGPAGHATLVADRLGLPADLTVLLNPAAEAGLLHEYRMAAARFFAANPAVMRSSGAQVWPSDMPPRLVMVAGRCERPPVPPGGTADAGQLDCDNVVENDFLMSQARAERRSEVLRRTGIGHLRYEGASTPEERQAVQVGTSGYVEVNVQRVAGVDRDRQPRNPTGYGLASSPTSRCMPEPAWLYCARTRGRNFARSCGRPGGGGDPFNRWDLGAGSGRLGADGRPLERTLGRMSEVRAPGQANIQLGYPSYRGARPAAAQRADPVWALDANRTAVSLHNTVASAPLLCALSKLVLDDPAAPGDPDLYVERWRADYWRRFGGAPMPAPRPMTVAPGGSGVGPSAAARLAAPAQVRSQGVAR